MDLSSINTASQKTNAQVSSNNGKDAASLPFWQRDIQLGNPFPDKKREAFFNELAILLEAGVDIKSSMDIIEEEQTKKKDKELFSGMRAALLEGKALSEVMREAKVFTPYEYLSVQIGEETGRTAHVLEQMAEYYQKKINQQRQIIGALSYPGIILFSAFGAIFFMMYFIVPMFADVFKQFGGELPFMTQIIMDFSNFTRKNFSWFLIGIGMLTTIYYLFKNNERFQQFKDTLMMRLPLFGPLIQKIYLARFAQSMSLLIASKVHLLRSTELVANMIAFYPISKALNNVQKEIVKGVPYYKTLEPYNVFPKRLISLIKVGEEVNQLDHFFSRIGEQYSKEVEHTSSMLSSLLEPFLIIFLGVVVGVLLIAMYLPMFQMSNNFGF